MDDTYDSWLDLPNGQPRRYLGHITADAMKAELRKAGPGSRIVVDDCPFMDYYVVTPAYKVECVRYARHD